jgi:hypothetical protein
MSLADPAPLPPACAIVNSHLGDGAAMCGCALVDQSSSHLSFALRQQGGSGTQGV